MQEESVEEVALVMIGAIGCGAAYLAALMYEPVMFAIVGPALNVSLIVVKKILREEHH
jgi:hypothetical protein